MAFLASELKAVGLQNVGKVEEALAVDVNLHVALLVTNSHMVPSFLDEIAKVGIVAVKVFFVSLCEVIFHAVAPYAQVAYLLIIALEEPDFMLLAVVGEILVFHVPYLGKEV
jgi:hypothetical protein